MAPTHNRAVQYSCKQISLERLLFGSSNPLPGFEPIHKLKANYCFVSRQFLFWTGIEIEKQAWSSLLNFLGGISHFEIYGAPSPHRRLR
jgi:hypothetical protein